MPGGFKQNCPVNIDFSSEWHTASVEIVEMARPLICWYKCPSFGLCIQQRPLFSIKEAASTAICSFLSLFVGLHSGEAAYNFSREARAAQASFVAP